MLSFEDARLLAKDYILVLTGRGVRFGREIDIFPTLEWYLLYEWFCHRGFKLKSFENLVGYIYCFFPDRFYDLESWTNHRDCVIMRDVIVEEELEDFRIFVRGVMCHG